MLPSNNDLNTQNYGYNRFQPAGQKSTATGAADKAAAAQTSSSEQVEGSASSRADGFDISALVNTIWKFASQRIAQAEADGASEDELNAMWDAAAAGVEQGFNEARDVLEDLGELDDALSMKINSAYGQIMDMIDQRDLSAQVPMPESSVEDNTAPSLASAPVNGADRGISLYQYQRQTFSLDLTTLEGDRIEIRSVFEQSASADDLRFGERSETTWGLQQQSGFSLMIKGNLSEQERADLDRLLAEVNELANEFYNGDLDRAFNMAQSLNIDGSSLRSMDLSLREVEQKGASVYAQMSDKPTQLPKGLAPLQDYANRLIEAQQKWQDSFNAPEGLLQAMENHPLNKGDLQHMARMMMV